MRDFWEEAGPAPSPAPRSHPGAGIPSRWEARLRQPQGNSEGSERLPFPSESIKKSSGKIPPAPGGQRRARGKELSPITRNRRLPPARIPDYPALISPPGSRRLHPPSPPCQKPGKKGPAALLTLPKELSQLFPLPLPKESKMAAREEREAIPRSCGSKAGSERVPGNSALIKPGKKPWNKEGKDSLRPSLPLPGSSLGIPRAPWKSRLPGKGNFVPASRWKIQGQGSHPHRVQRTLGKVPEEWENSQRSRRILHRPSCSKAGRAKLPPKEKTRRKIRLRGVFTEGNAVSQGSQQFKEPST